MMNRLMMMMTTTTIILYQPINQLPITPIHPTTKPNTTAETPSLGAIHMTSTWRGRGQAQADECGRGEGGPAQCGRPHRKLKLESTDVILSSSHAKKLASFFNQNFVFGQKKSGNFSAI